MKLLLLIHGLITLWLLLKVWQQHRRWMRHKATHLQAEWWSHARKQDVEAKRSVADTLNEQ